MLLNLKKLFLLFLFVAFQIYACAQNITIYGNVTDSISGENLSDVYITINHTISVVSTNSYGFYSITFNNNINKLLFFHCLGYEQKAVSINFKTDTIINIQLVPKSYNLGEVIVNSNSERKSNIKNTQKVSIQEIKAKPGLAGEADVLKTIQLLPGVNVSNEGTTNLSIRGGSHDQNLILLDEAPVYNPSHALSFISAFNPDAIQSMEIYKSAFPPKYGGRTSSVIDVKMKEGNNQSLKINGGIGIIASRLSLESPIVKNKSSFIISGRYSYAGFFSNKIKDLIKTPALDFYQKGNEINFYDFNVKGNVKLGNKDRLYISFYTGKDHFYVVNFGDNYSMDWGNLTSTIRWNHIFNDKLFANSSLILSNYNYKYLLKNDKSEFNWSANMQEYQFKTDFNYYMNSKNSIKYGLLTSLFKTLPGNISPANSSSLIVPYSLDSRTILNFSGYIEDDFILNDIISLQLGLRGSSFFELGKRTTYKYSADSKVIDSTVYNQGSMVQKFYNLEPRLASTFQLSRNSSIKISFTRTTQYLHLMSNSTVGLPTDIWLPASNNVLPQKADQYSFAYYHHAPNSIFESSVEIYYKRLIDVIDFKDNADLFLNKHIESQILQGDGKAYGAEFFIKKSQGKLTGWLSYTISKVTKKIDGINQNQSYPATYDKRHNLSILSIYNINRNLQFSAVFKLVSGGHITMPIGNYNYYGASFAYYSSRNNYEMPWFHQLDISATYKPTMKNKRWKSEWVFSINDVYNHKNVFALFVRQDPDNFNSTAYKMYLWGIFPSITYNFSF